MTCGNWYVFHEHFPCLVALDPNNQVSGDLSDPVNRVMVIVTYMTDLELPEHPGQDWLISLDNKLECYYISCGDNHHIPNHSSTCKNLKLEKKSPPPDWDEARKVATAFLKRVASGTMECRALDQGYLCSN